MAARYLFNYRNHQPSMSRDGDYLYSTDGEPKPWIDGQYGYSYETQKPSLWFDGKYAYGLNADASLSGTDPLYYYAD